jgi:type II secretory pathway component PulF
MFFANEISVKDLARLSQRLGDSLHAGLDIRKTMETEAKRASSSKLRRRLEEIKDSIDRGASFSEALDRVGEYFPPLVKALVRAGEESGRLAETLQQLGEHYEERLRMKRAFLASIAWPLIELGLAVLVIAILILVLGMVSEMTGSEVDTLGWGLTGFNGMFIFLTFVFIAVTAFTLLMIAFRRGMTWCAPLQKGLLRIPVLGPFLNSLALERLCWAMSMTFSTGMEVQRAVRMSLEAVRNAKYSGKAREIDEALGRGANLTEAFERSGEFSGEFISELEVGERTGKVSEVMARMSANYQSRSKTQSKVLSVVGFFVVFGIIAALLIFVIVSLFVNAYLGPINDALDMSLCVPPLHPSSLLSLVSVDASLPLL